MNFKDIVNRDLVNLTNCESEPIHIPGTIQPHGFLIAVTEDTLEITFCSANVLLHTGLSHEQLLGTSYGNVFGDAQAKAFRQYSAGLDSSYSAPLELEFSRRSFYATVHRSGGLYVIECEPASAAPPDMTAMFTQTRRFAAYMEGATSLRSLCQSVCDHTRAITGYDRVMIYRFDQDSNGEVIAESKTDAVESFMGLHYPHTDIPPQARQLYVKNPIRVIADVDYTPVPIYTLGDKTNKDLDLTNSVLRSVSPIHVQYLHNMGVGASMSISLIHEGKLWGLIACHHYSPRPVGSYARISAMLQGHFMTSQISVREVAAEYAVSKEVIGALETMLSTDFPMTRDSFAQMAEMPELLDLCHARGVAILIDGVIYRGGETPCEDDIHKLAYWFSTASLNGHFNSANLVSSYDDALRICDKASGIIFQALDMAQRNSIIWFRPETIKEITWAGEPDKTIEKDRAKLSPRLSFAAWSEEVKCKSIEWQKPELTAAAGFAHSLQKHINTLFLSEEENRYRQLNAKLKEAYAELENLNWISTHDLREPLRKIQVFISQIIDDDENELSVSVSKSLEKIQVSAVRMQNLINDVLSFSKLRQVDENFTTVDLNILVEDVMQEVEDEIKDKTAAVNINHMPTMEGASFLLHQLFSNLIRNSLKFAKATTPSQIDINYNGIVEYAPVADVPAGHFHRITFSDNGIGFDDKYSESIFKVFTRLHPQSAYGGTGVGLALCRKIMENHHGYITASGIPDQGSTFTLYFPAQPPRL